MSEVQYPDVHVQLSGEDGNAFAIMGAVAKAIRKQVGSAEATQYQSDAMSSESYDALLVHAMNTVNVS